MNLLKLLFLFSLVNSVAMAADIDDGGESEVKPSLRLETIRQRYKDFYRRQEEIDAENEKLEVGIPVVKKVREADKKEQEAALKEFLKSRKPTHEDPRAEELHNMEVKAEKEQMEVWRKRYVGVRDHIQAVEKKGIKIPEKSEYELEE